MAEAFFHRKTAVFNYFQLAIEILAWTRSRKPLCLQVWNFDPIDSFSQIWSHCSYPKWLDAKLKSSPIFSKVTQIHQAFGILLIETMSPRTFKNRPIWSHRMEAFFQPEAAATIKVEWKGSYALDLSFFSLNSFCKAHSKHFCLYWYNWCVSEKMFQCVRAV